jgi:hypothetical protein
MLEMGHLFPNIRSTLLVEIMEMITLECDRIAIIISPENDIVLEASISLCVSR